MSAGRWAELVEAWESGGRSAREVAEERGVSEASLRWWRSELARRARSQPARRSPGPGRNRNRAVVLAKIVREGAAPPVSADERASRSVVIVVGVARIVVEPNFDAPLLRAVVHALSERQ